MRTITLEEHFATPRFLEGPGRDLKEAGREIQQRPGAQAHPPALRPWRQAYSRNGRRRHRHADRIADGPRRRTIRGGRSDCACRRYQRLCRGRDQEAPCALWRFRRAADRGAGQGRPRARAPRTRAEIRRRIINGHNRGRYLDDKFFWPILESAEQLGAPIYLHPTRPPQPVIDASFSGFSPLVSEIFSGPGWGWHIETAVHVIRLILGGVFDRFPKLQIVIGHLGEGLPGMFQRLDIMAPAVTTLKRPVTAYLRENIHYTFSGFFFPPTFLALLLELGGVDRMMFSVDHPYQSIAQEDGAFLEQLPVSAADKERIAHGNAEKLFKL